MALEILGYIMCSLGLSENGNDYLEKLMLTITSEQKENGEDIRSASGEYTFQYLSSNNTPIFIREHVRRGNGWDYTYVTYRLSYRNGLGWGLRWKETYDSSWKDAKLVFRLQTDCKYLI